jgi:hypothetical protein
MNDVAAAAALVSQELTTDAQHAPLPERHRPGDPFGVHERAVRRAQILRDRLAVDERHLRVEARDLHVGAEHERLSRVTPDGQRRGTDLDPLPRLEAGNRDEKVRERVRRRRPLDDRLRPPEGRAQELVVFA